MIKNLIHKWFYKTKIKNKEDTDNAIIFLLDINNQPQIKIQISNIDIESSIKFGELLYSIDNGYMQKSIVDVLLEISKQDLGVNKFVQDSLSHWIFKNNQDTLSNNEPVVPPTSFNQMKYEQN